MNEFIVWNKRSKAFIRGNDFKINHKGVLVDFMGLRVNSKSFFNYIGKKDINDKKIYAESSIIEFEWRESLKLDLMPTEHVKGYFYYNKNTLSYRLIPLNVGSERTEYCDLNKVSNIKIIDSIQENKLGLIKWKL